MKRFNIILTTILGGFGGLFINNTASAMVTRTIEERWWTIPEIIEMSKEAEQERIERCDGEEGIECYLEVRNEQMERGAKYEMVDMVENFRFMVTGLDFERGEITFFVNQENPMLAQATSGFAGIGGKTTRAELVWLEDDSVYASYLRHLWDGVEVEEGMHILYQYEGEDLVKGGETTVMAREDLRANSGGVIEFFEKRDNGENTIGTINVESCMSKEEATGCRLMISENANMEFMAFGGEDDEGAVRAEDNTEDESGFGDDSFTKEANTGSRENVDMIKAPRAGVEGEEDTIKMDFLGVWSGVGALTGGILGFLLKSRKKVLTFDVKCGKMMTV